jgi:ABC-2 type transport system ATP-binding protein
MSTHILGDVERICDSIGIINHGKLVAVGERQDLLGRYTSPVTEVIFDASENEVRAWGESIRKLRFVREVKVRGNVVRVGLDADEGDPLELQNRALGSKLILQSYQQVKPQLEDVFLSLVRK